MLRYKKITIAAMLVFAMLCCCAFSFAAFQQTVKVNGTVLAKSEYDVYFVKDSSNTLFIANDTITCNPNTVKCTVKSGADADKSAGQYDTLTLDVKTPWNFSGSATFTVYVHNAGTVPAVIEATQRSDGSVADSNNNAFTMSCTPQTLAAGETEPLTITLAFASGKTVKSDTEYAGLQIQLVYGQETPATYVLPTHATHAAG